MSILEFKNFKNLLESEIKKSSNVFIIGHNGPDFDSIGACIGLAVLAEHFHKDACLGAVEGSANLIVVTLGVQTPVVVVAAIGVLYLVEFKVQSINDSVLGAQVHRGSFDGTNLASRHVRIIGNGE